MPHRDTAKRRSPVAPRLALNEHATRDHTPMWSRVADAPILDIRPNKLALRAALAKWLTDLRSLVHATGEHFSLVPPKV
jgi:hypothetical protein